MIYMFLGQIQLYSIILILVLYEKFVPGSHLLMTAMMGSRDLWIRVSKLSNQNRDKTILVDINNGT